MRFNTKVKAKELFELFLNKMPKYLQGKLGRETAKENSLLCVNEVIETLYDEGYDEFDDKIIRWLEVKDELETFN